MNKHSLINKIKQLDGLTDKERSELVELLNTKKKYGLVWEDKPEAVEEELRTKLPVLREVVERRILSESESSELENEQNKTVIPKTIGLFDELNKIENPENQINQDTDIVAPNHILIEGDNLHALTALSFTHEGQIDVIYIDPPYNTGAKNWLYNNDYVDKEDAFRHSKFISFMEHRLLIAKRLLSSNGILICAIDDYEIHNIRHLLDEIFGQDNRLGTVVVVHNPRGRNDDRFIATMHEYMLFYAKDFNQATISLLPLNKKDIAAYNKSDDISDFNETSFIRTGNNSLRTERPNLYYPIYYNPITDKLQLDEDLNLVKLLPNNGKDEERTWRWGQETFFELKDTELFVKKVKGEYKIYKKRRISNIIGKKPKTVWTESKYDASSNGIMMLQSIFNGSNPFPYPKSFFAVLDTLQITSTKYSVILDFFAGSGTTLHATMQLNAEDGGNRQCILVTNNENNICEEVTYERNKRIIQGYTNSKGNWVNGLTNNNLRYYRSEYVSSQKTEQNKRLLTQASTELLQIKENCYTDITSENDFDSSLCELFTNERGKYLIVLFHSRKQLAVIELLVEWIKSLTDTTEKIKLYAFSPEKETLMADFWEVADKIEAVPLPEAIYNAYRAAFKTIKLNKKPAAISTEDNLQTDEE